MDKKLLDGLNNLSLALEEIALSLNKKGSKSSTAEAIKGGNFVSQITEIKIGVKKLQEDTKAILKNQQTIISISKQKNSEKKTEVFEKAGEKNTKKMIKDGVAIVLLMATGVLAIGLAFKLIGAVKFTSVIALAIALPLIAFAFQKIAQMKDLTPKQSFNLVIITVAISTAVMISSWILAKVSTIGLKQFFSIVFISGIFTVLAFGMKNILRSLKGVSILDAMKTAITLPIVMVAMSLAIVGASYLLGMVKPIGLAQFFTTIFISAAFSILSFGLKDIVKAMKGVNIKDAITIALSLPIVMVAMAAAIVGASYLLGSVKPIGLSQFISTIFISVVFVILSFGMRQILRAFKDLDTAKAIKISFVLPIVYVALAGAIAASSYLLALTKPIDYGLLFNILVQGLIMAALSFTLGFAIKFLGKMDMTTFFTGALFVIVLAAAIMISSLLLGLGTYEKYPSIDWALGVGISLIAFGAVAAGLGALAMSGVGGAAVLLGIVFTIVIAAAIMVSSFILSQGKYEVFPGPAWSLGVALALGSFAMASVALGFIAISGIGAVALLVGIGMTLKIAKTIVEVSNILSQGNWKGGPTFGWVAATTLAYMAFTPMIVALGALGMAGAVIKFFGGPDPFELAKKMMIQIADTMVAVSHSFGGGDWKGGPTKKWAEGVGLAIGAFAPVFATLSKGGIMGILFGNGPSVEEYKNTIKSVAEGIVEAGKVFNEAGMDQWKKAPTKEWSQGVGIAIQAFSSAIHDMKKSGVKINRSELYGDKGLITVMIGVAEGIIAVGMFFNKFGGIFDVSKVPSKKWADGVGISITSFASAIKDLKEGGIKKGDLKDGGFTDIMVNLADALIKVAEKFNFNAGENIFDLKKIPSKKWGSSVGEAIKSMVSIYKVLDKDGFTPDYINSYSGSVGALVTGMISTATIISRRPGIFKSFINPDFISNLSKNIRAYVDMAKYVQNSRSTGINGIVDSLVGKKDPMESIINGMFGLGAAYLALSSSIREFGDSLSDIDVEKLEALRNMTGNIVLLSLLNPEQFELMMDVLEKKAGVIVDLVGQIDEGKSKTTTGLSNVSTKTTKPDKSQHDVLQMLTSMNQQLGIIAKNTGKFSQYVDELRSKDTVKLNRNQQQ